MFVKVKGLGGGGGRGAEREDGFKQLFSNDIDV